MSDLYDRYAREGSSIESITFSADIDAAAYEIQRVCTGAASDEAALASLLLSKTAEQRYLIWWRYRLLYKQSLTMWVKSTNDYGILLKMLASPLEHVEAEILRKATKGLGTTERWIYPVVVARSNSDIALLKKTFREKYGKDLVQTLSSDLSGDLKKVILTAMRGEVADFNATVHTRRKAAAHADALYKAGEGRWGTDETMFINILVLNPPEHVRNVNSAYVEKYKMDLVGVIKAEFSRHTKRSLLFLVRSVLEPMELLAELFETTLNRVRKDTYGLSAWVVRYYRFLVHIGIVYKRLYRQELRTRIEGVASGEYCQLLLSVFDAAKVEIIDNKESEVTATPSRKISGDSKMEGNRSSIDIGAATMAAIGAGTAAAIDVAAATTTGAVIGSAVSATRSKTTQTTETTETTEEETSVRDEVDTPMVGKAEMCSSCTVLSDASEAWCRCCGFSMKAQVTRNSLAKYLKTHPAVNGWRQIYEVALVLQDLHDQGILHDAVKPANLAVGRDGKTHLYGLESCKRIEELVTGCVTSSKEELRWWAPECLDGGHASLASDIYSLAMCVIYAISGEPPWGSSLSDEEIKGEVCQQHAAPPRPQVFSNDAWALVDRMCDYDPRKRITVDEAVQQLAILTPADSTAAPMWRVPKTQISISRHFVRVKSRLSLCWAVDGCYSCN